MGYKWCVVPKCISTSKKTPEKLFVPVPLDPERRKKWLSLALRNPKSIGPNSSVYMCEDHFNIPNDMENYMQYHIMGSVSRVRIKPRAFPSKFECQKINETSTVARPLNKKRKILIGEDLERRTEMIECAKQSGKSPEITHFENTDQVLSISRSNSPTESNCEQNAEAILYPACNICKEDIIGLRYVCVQCSDWDMCGSCEAAGVHDHHYVLRLPRTNDVPRNHLDDLIQSIQQKLALLQTDIEIKTEFLLPDEEEATLHDSEMITFKDEPQDCVEFPPPEEAVVPTALPSSTNTPEPADSNNILITTKYFSFHVPQTKNEQTLKPTASKIVKKLKHARSRKKINALCLCEDNLEKSKSKVKKKIAKRKNVKP